MSVFPLDIPEKTDSPELQAFFQQFGLNRYLSAEEINKITAALAELKEVSGNVSIINTIFVNNGFDKTGQLFKGFAGTQWNINGFNYARPTDQEITIPLCAAGKVRTDRMVLDTNNNYVRVPGVEVDENPVPEAVLPNTLDYTLIPVNDSSVGDPDIPTIGNIFNKKDYDKVYTFNASGTDVEIPFNVSGFSTIELTGSLTSVKGFSFTDLTANPTLAEWPHKGKPIILINRSGHNIELKHNDLTAILPFNFDSGSSIIIPNNGKFLLKSMTNAVIDIFKSWVDAGVGSSEWVDYSSISTIVGWSSFYIKKIFYKIIDNYMFVSFTLDGTSNSGTTSFTLPNASSAGFNILTIGGYIVNNTAPLNQPPQIKIINGSNNILLYSDLIGSGWVASGQKGISGQFSFKIN